MKNKLRYSPEALNDLDETWEYIMMELGNPNAAENVVSNIINSIDKLKDFAKMGTPLSIQNNIESDYRFLLSGNYMIFYRVSESNIYIDRILYGKRDYLHTLFPSSEKK
ncbi:type II toxin-antitoxin system RelE/ParE family toxin [Lachnospiraceae bacterium OttesenSCG-928-J05]|nr:type II toxin-antitoxin system RelE/ParE family toxin [Lachnospiraceae bacterium OttesenSCG-928-J05]